MASTDLRNKPFFQRNAWIVFIVVAGIFTLFGVGDVIRGMDADPAIAESILGTAWKDVQGADPAAANLIDLMVRSQGAVIAVLSVLSIAMTANAFRRGERWAWFALWIWPVLNIAVFLLFLTADRQPGFTPPPPMLSAPVFFGITSLALLLSYRRYFPKG